MDRPLLSNVHPNIREKIAMNHKATVEEVQAAIAAHPVVVVGMAQNPVVKKARALLTEKGIAFHYIEYGSYLSEWRRRNALKMWTGWPTFPMVFAKGVLLGGYDDIAKLFVDGSFPAI